MSSPDSRGTLDILWSSLFTIIACTWTIQHLNIPEQRNNLREKSERRRQRSEFCTKEGRFFSRLWYDIRNGASEFWLDLMWSIRGFWSNLKWMLFTMIAPEFILGKAIGDFVGAWNLKKKMEEYAIRDNVEWGLSHGFFANMGGFRYIPKEREKNIPTPSDAKVQEKEDQTQPSTTTIETDSQPRQESLVLPKSDLQLNIDGQDVVNSYILTGERILNLRSTNKMGKLPGITATEIHDRGKSNIFVKVVAVIQVLWTAVQVIVRSVRGLTVSQLELVVTSFSLCAIITYLFLIQKPQGVQTATRPIEIGFIVYEDQWLRLRQFFLPGRIKSDPDFILDLPPPPRARVPNDYIQVETERDLMPYPLGMAIGGVLFGAVHIAGWNLSFPSSVDQELWHISSILMTFLLPIACLPLILGGFDQDLFGILPLSREIVLAVIRAWGFGFGMLYMVARLILLVETFRTLVFLPPDAFVSTWVSNIPNVS